MQLTVIGTGYVGLVTGTCFAESGNDVACMDIDRAKIARLAKGEIPIYEPGLEELVERNLAVGRLRFTGDLGEAVQGAQLIFITVGTPEGDDGAADLRVLLGVVDDLAAHLAEGQIVVIKSTAPVGTNAKVAERLREKLGRPVHVATNPEFLKEGAAVEDFTKPDRVVVGVRQPEIADVLRELYAPFLRTERPFLVMSPESAEMTKYVANAMLATKISFINEMANLCERTGSDIDEVRRGIGHDARIGFAFLFPGPGYGGSCFPKDVRALAALARSVGLEPRMLAAVDAVNEAQKRVLLGKIVRHFVESRASSVERRGSKVERRKEVDSQLSTLRSQLSGRTIAVWGLAFKPRTDDIREAPALTLIDGLLAAGARLQVHDPEAMENVRAVYGDRLTYCPRPYDALQGADALAVVTEWAEFRNPDFARMRRLMREPVVFDGRNLYDPARMARVGFRYYGIGK